MYCSFYVDAYYVMLRRMMASLPIQSCLVESKGAHCHDFPELFSIKYICWLQNSDMLRSISLCTIINFLKIKKTKFKLVICFMLSKIFVIRLLRFNLKMKMKVDISYICVSRE